jgi:hypothetical protein
VTPLEREADTVRQSTCQRTVSRAHPVAGLKGRLSLAIVEADTVPDTTWRTADSGHHPPKGGVRNCPVSRVSVGLFSKRISNPDSDHVSRSDREGSFDAGFANPQRSAGAVGQMRASVDSVVGPAAPSTARVVEDLGENATAPDASFGSFPACREHRSTP